MDFIKVQISDPMRKHTEKENDLHDLTEIMLENMMVAEQGEFLREIPAIRITAIVLGRPMAKAGERSFIFPMTVVATSIPGFLRFPVIRKKSTTGWWKLWIRRGLYRNRSGMSLIRFIASTIPSPASAEWSKAFVCK